MSDHPDPRIATTSPASAGRNALAAKVLPLAFIVACMPVHASVPSISTGKAISGMCAACHGSDGRAVVTRYPNLAGQNYQYLLHQLEAFKAGKRKSPIMHSNTLDLSRQKMKDLAAYFANLGPRSCTTGKDKPRG